MTSSSEHSIPVSEETYQLYLSMKAPDQSWDNLLHHIGQREAAWREDLFERAEELREQEFVPLEDV